MSQSTLKTAPRQRRNPVPKDVLKELESCPGEGSGVHQWIYQMACRLWPHCTPEESFEHLLAATTAAGVQRDTQREIRDAVRNSDPFRETAQSGNKPKFPKRSDAAIREVMSSGVTQAVLERWSPVGVGEMPQSSGAMLDCLFPSDALLCIGRNARSFLTRPLSEWQHWLKDVSQYQYIVPSPMSARVGKAIAGHLSAKTNDNTGPRQFLVVEFDFEPGEVPTDAALLRFGRPFGIRTTRDLCACLLDHLATLAPLAMVVWSGGKSLHGWFPVGGVTESKVSVFFQHACRLGADRMTWTPSQFVRLPWGRNTKTSEVQRVLYWNPHVLLHHTA